MVKVTTHSMSGEQVVALAVGLRIPHEIEPGRGNISGLRRAVFGHVIFVTSRFAGAIC